MDAGSSSRQMLCSGVKAYLEDDQVNQVAMISVPQDSLLVPPGFSAPTGPSRAAPPKRRRNQSGTANQEAEVVALSPTTLMSTNRFVCEVCHKGFQREQNLQLHRRGHNLPWKLKQKTKDAMRKKVYLCPEPSCTHHDPARALGDLTGIKKHFSRKHGEKKFNCDKCNKMYAVQSDCKAHSKICGTKEYKCECGTVFSRRDSFVSHRAFCNALTRESSMAQPPTLHGTRSTLYESGTNNTNINSNFKMSNLTLPQFGSQVPSYHHPVHTFTPPHLQTAPVMPHLAHFRGENTHTIDPSVGFDCYKPPPALSIPSSDQQNPHEFQEHFDDGFLANLMNTSSNNNANLNINGDVCGTVLGNAGNYASGEGSSLFPAGATMPDHPFSDLYSSPLNTNPNLSATALLQKAASLGPSSSDNSISTILRGYASSSSSGIVGNGNPNFGMVNNNGRTFNPINGVGSSGVGVGSMSFNRYGGSTFFQGDNYGGGSSYGSGQGQHPPQQNIHGKKEFEDSDGLTMTRDFLGVGAAGQVVRNISSRGHPSTHDAGN